MARTKNEETPATQDGPPNVENAALIAGNTPERAAALQAFEEGRATREIQAGDLEADHADKTAELEAQIAKLRDELALAKREMQAKADEAGATVPARHDRAGDMLAAPTPPAQSGSRDLADEPTQTVFKLNAAGELVAEVRRPTETVVINQVREGGEYIVRGVRVNAEGIPIRGGKTPAPENPPDLISMPNPD